MQKLPRVVRLDGSDPEVYERAAEPGEWAVVGSFHFWDGDPQGFTGQRRQAFRHGFLGTDSFGWGTLVAVAEITPVELELATQRLARHLVEHFGAPDLDAALPAAREEIAYAAGLCEHPVNTLLSVQRDAAGDDIQETIRVIQPNAGGHDALQFWGVEPEAD